MIISLLITIAIPQFLGVIRWRCYLDQQELTNKERLCYICITILILIGSPFFLMYQKFYLFYLEMKLGLIPNHDETVKEFEKTKRLLNLHIKLELGLETIYQISGQLILLGLAFTEVGFFYKNKRLTWLRLWVLSQTETIITTLFTFGTFRKWYFSLKMLLSKPKFILIENFCHFSKVLRKIQPRWELGCTALKLKVVILPEKRKKCISRR